MAKKKLLNKQKFIVSIGDEGAVIILWDGVKVKQRQFIDVGNYEEISNTLESSPRTPVYLLVDVLDQAYIQHTLPPVSALNVGQLVKRRLEKDFANEEIKTARKLYRDKKGRKDWYYSFISVHNDAPFSDWLHAIVEAPNDFKGIFLLPIESENFIKKLSTSINPKEKEQVEWQILVSHNKVGGFREIVYKNGKVVFTRIAQPIGGQAPDVVAGNIEQETLNTIEYVRRLGFESDDELDIYIVASSAVKTALNSNSLQARSINILTPYETAQKIGLDDVVEKSDRFGDIVMASNFAKSPNILKFNSPYTKKIEQIYQAKTVMNAIVYILAPLLIFLSLSNIGEIFDFQEKITKAEKDKKSAQTRLNLVRTKTGNLPDNADEILEVIDLNEKLTKDNYLPLDFVKKFSLIKPKNASVEKIDISIEEDFVNGNTIKVDMSVLVRNESRNIDYLLEDYDRFSETIREEFADYEVDFSGIPTAQDRLSLDTSSPDAAARTVGIIIEGPKSRMANQNRRGRRRR